MDAATEKKVEDLLIRMGTRLGELRAAKKRDLPKAPWKEMIEPLQRIERAMWEVGYAVVQEGE